MWSFSLAKVLNINEFQYAKRFKTNMMQLTIRFLGEAIARKIRRLRGQIEIGCEATLSA